MPQKKLVSALLLGLVLCGSQTASAMPISLGIVSFDTFIPGPDGTNAFFVSNFTGDPGTGGFALPPDFPVATFVTFDSPMLSWIGPSGSPYNFGGVGIGPGSLDPASPIQFPDTAPFLSATFSALLSTNRFQSTDGRLFQAASPTVTATLTDVEGGALLPGDFALLSVEASEVTPASPIPEPTSMMLFASGLVGCVLWKSRSAREIPADVNG